MRTLLAVQAPPVAAGGYLPVDDSGTFTVILPYLGGVVLVALWVWSAWFIARSVAGDRGLSESVRALAVVVWSATLGGTYFAYLRAEPFPPDLVRIVPLLWLIGCVAGWLFVARALRSDTPKFAVVVGVTLNVPNTCLAALFSFAALTAG